MSDGHIGYTIGINGSLALAGIRVVQAGIAGLARTAAFAGVAAGATAAVGAVGLLGKALKEAATAETDETGLKVMLRDAEEAKRVMGELNAFSDSTPFEPGPVIEAGKKIIAYGFTLSDLKGVMTDAGDVAAAFNVDIGETARVMGRLKAGDFGEAFERMRDFGISRQDLEGEGLEFDKGGSFQGTAEQALEAVRKLIQEKYGGTMAETSRTSAGLLSTLKGKITAVFRELGTPVNAELKGVLQDAAKWATELAPKAREFGQILADKIGLAIEIARNGDLGTVIGGTIKVAFMEAVNALWAGLSGAFEAAGIVFMRVFDDVVGKVGVAFRDTFREITGTEPTLKDAAEAPGRTIGLGRATPEQLAAIPTPDREDAAVKAFRRGAAGAAPIFDPKEIAEMKRQRDERIAAGAADLAARRRAAEEEQAGRNEDLKKLKTGEGEKNPLADARESAQANVDSLKRVGLDVGSGGGAPQRLAERTAKGIETITKLLSRTLKVELEGDPLAAVF